MASVETTHRVTAVRLRKVGVAAAVAAALTAAAVAAMMTSPAHAGLAEAGELEHARANARAGGPLSERDRYLLERHGCLSGTRNSFCQSLEGRSAAKSSRKRKKRYTD